MQREAEAYLAGVEVVARSINLGVVVVEEGGVDRVRGHEAVAGVARGDNVGGGAVLTLGAKAEDLTGGEVVADRVNAGVHSSELEPGGG